MADKKSLSPLTKYKKQYDEMVLNWLSKGETLADFAIKIGVNNVTIYRWKNEHESFCKSVKEGQEISREINAEKFLKDAVRDNAVQSVPFVMYCRNVLKLKTKDENKNEINLSHDELMSLDVEELNALKKAQSILTRFNK